MFRRLAVVCGGLNVIFRSLCMYVCMHCYYVRLDWWLWPGDGLTDGLAQRSYLTRPILVLDTVDMHALVAYKI